MGSGAILRSVRDERAESVESAAPPQPAEDRNEVSYDDLCRQVYLLRAEHGTLFVPATEPISLPQQNIAECRDGKSCSLEDAHEIMGDDCFAQTLTELRLTSSSERRAFARVPYSREELAAARESAILIAVPDIPAYQILDMLGEARIDVTVSGDVGLLADVDVVPGWHLVRKAGSKNAEGLPPTSVSAFVLLYAAAQAGFDGRRPFTGHSTMTTWESTDGARRVAKCVMNRNGSAFIRLEG